jgi:copper transport protein
LFLLAALVSQTSIAQAHAIVLRSDPPDGAVLGAPPKQIRLWMSEPVALGFTTVELIDSTGQRIPVAARSDAASLALTVRGAGTSTALLLIDLPALPPSAYRLSWRTLSSGDLHVTSGSIVFGVQRAVDLAPVAATAPAPPPAEVLLRWLNFGALAALVGALAIAHLALPAATKPTRIRARLLRLALCSSLTAFALGIGLLLTQATGSGSQQESSIDNLWRIISGTSYGGRWLLCQALLVALGLAILGLLQMTARATLAPSYARIPPPRAAPPTPRPVPSAPHAAPALPHAAPFPTAVDERSRVRPVMGGLVAILVLALVITQALNSHAAAFNELLPVRVLADALHLLAAGLWVGGLLALTVAVTPLLRHNEADRALAWSILRRFGLLAAIGLATLLATGLYASGQQVASLDALLTTLYGQTLIAKFGLALGVALIGLLNAATLHPRVADTLRRILRRPAISPQLERMVLLECAGATLILLLAALLSATTPARGPAFEPPAEEPPPPTITTRADDLVVTLAVKPNRPGQNFVGLGVFNTRRPAPAPIDRVMVRLSGPGERGTDALLTADPQGGGRYQIAGDTFAGAGDWRITVMVSRPGLPESRVTIPWTVLPLERPAERRPVLVSNRPLVPALTLAALLVALLPAGVSAALWLKRRRTRAMPAPIRRQAQPAPATEKRGRA